MLSSFWRFDECLFRTSKAKRGCFSRGFVMTTRPSTTTCFRFNQCNWCVRLLCCLYERLKGIAWYLYLSISWTKNLQMKRKRNFTNCIRPYRNGFRRSCTSACNAAIRQWRASLAAVSRRSSTDSASRTLCPTPSEVGDRRLHATRKSDRLFMLSTPVILTYI